jgi:outer membrane protein
MRKLALTPIIVLATLGACGSIANAQTTSDAGKSISGLSAAQVFEVALKAEEAGDVATAQAAYSALTQDPDVAIRSEARFRHGRLLTAQKRLVEAAVLYRMILDEQPEAGRVRLELAGLLYQMGDSRGALRMLRQAQAGGLPPEVAQVVNQFTGALRSFKPFGGSIEFALAPDSNINRATTADTLDTIIAPLQLSEDGQQQSGIGVKLGGQGYVRLPLSAKVRALGRLSGQGNFYRKSAFNDISGSAQLGLEWFTGKAQLSPSIGRTYRWYGKRLYARTDTASLNWRHRLGQKAQLDADVAIGRSKYIVNPLQSGEIYDASIGYERAFTARSGGSITFSGQRQTAADPGYATASGGVGLLYWREIGKTTAFVTANVRRLEADARLLLFTDRRKETYLRAGAGMTFRQIQFKGFSPLVRVSHERNMSTVGIYDYKRNAIELGISRAF